MSERDPRVDPRPGDEIALEDWRHLVIGRPREGRVLYTTWVGGMHLNSTCTASLEEWTDLARNAEIVKRGEYSP